MPNWAGGAGGAVTGAKIGSMILPGIGTGIGALAGGLFGLFKGGKKKKPIGGSGEFDLENNLQGMATTGGYSDEDMANLRARSVSPIRAAYSAANRDVDRQRSLQGGYSPNYTAAKAKMAREQSYAMSDAMTNVEGGLAESKRQGRLAGLQGLLTLRGQPSDYQNKLSSIGGTMNVIGQGAQAIYPWLGGR